MKLYGAAYSRAGRCVWMLEEIGKPYENVPTSPRSGETRAPAMLTLNPNGHVPVLDDDGYIIWESMAVNLYLAEKHQVLWPADLKARGHATQWSFWAMTEVEPPLITLLMNRMFLPEDQRDEKAAQQAEQNLKNPLKVLDAHLAGRQYILGGDFTVADLNVCSVLGLTAFLQYDLSGFPQVGGWLGRCNSRPAAQRYHQKAQQAMSG
jgi:glutathione S-transferase